MHAALKRLLLEAASEPYRVAGNFAYQFARGKLGGDPVFAHLLEQGLLHSDARVLDLGCGSGLLAAWFLAAERLRGTDHVPADFNAPTGIRFHGVDLNAEACAIGQCALRPLYGAQLSLAAGDMCQADLQGYDTITMLDVLHYISYEQQDALLDRLSAALAPNGCLILRVGNARGGWRFRFSQWVDLMVAHAHGHHLRRLYCRSHAAWEQALQQRGLAVRAQPMSQGTPFANVLLIARTGRAEPVK